MEIIKKCKLDLAEPGFPVWLSAVQNDDRSRILELTLLSGGKSWIPPEGVSAAVSYRRSDGVSGLYDTLADGTAAVAVCGNVLRVCIAGEMLILAGTVTASVVLCHNGKQLSTFPFFIKITADPAAGSKTPAASIPAKTLAGLHNSLSSLKAETDTLEQSLQDAQNRIPTQDQIRAMVKAQLALLPAAGTTDINIRKWFGKKLLVDGSSITTGGLGQTLPTWPSFLKDMFGLSQVYNHAVSGTGWFIGSSTVLQRTAEYEADADAVILMGDYNGIYNYAQGIGTVTDAPNPDGSCYARLKYLAQVLVEKYPLCPIIWVIEPPRAEEGNVNSALLPMSQDSIYLAYSAIIEEVAELYGFSHCNLMKNTVFRPWIPENYAATTADGVHPWNNIQRTMAQVIAETMTRTPLIYNESYEIIPDYDDSGSDSTEKTVTSLSVTPLSGYALFENDTLRAVRDCIRVVAGYSDLSEAGVTDYSVSGNLTAGEQTFTITYSGVSATVTLTVTAGYRTKTLVLTEQNVTAGSFLLKIDGVETPSANEAFGYTDYIPVLGGTDVVFSDLANCHGLNNGFSEYDKDKKHINFVDTSYGIFTYTLSANAAYIRVNLDLATTDTITIVAV